MLINSKPHFLKSPTKMKNLDQFTMALTHFFNQEEMFTQNMLKLFDKNDCTSLKLEKKSCLHNI